MGSQTTIIKTKPSKSSSGGGSKKGRQSAHRKGKYLKQKTRTTLNKARARKKHAIAHPNDFQEKLTEKEGE
uniref:Uncharacterized protein n=1 Tax=viral metagenome TaxID=1070528 RepID=A0A6H1ZRP7_9ZZZZ